jgi:hypothetical protein
MNTTLRNLLACMAGVLLGSIVNMGIVLVGPTIVPPPPGVDVTSSESLHQSIHLFEPKHFVAPFLAHALGTLAGSSAAFLLAATRRRALAYGVGALFFAGGVAAATMIPAPPWFVALDLAGAYFPMSFLGIWLGRRIRPGATR